MQGKSADLAKRAIPSLRKTLILLTFGKYRPKKTLLPSEGTFSTSSASNPLSIPTSARPSSCSRYPSARKPYGIMPANGILHAQQAPQIMLSPNGVQPHFAAAPMVAPPATGGWATVSPMNATGPRPPVPGTGVFLPPGSVHIYPTQQLPGTPTSVETIYGNGSEKPASNSNASDSSPNITTDLIEPVPECNSDGWCLDTAAVAPNQEHHHSVEKADDNLPESVAK